jgi:hypothetical protein
MCPQLFGTMATAVAFTFGHENFGKLWGVLYMIAGCMNFGLAALSELAKSLGTYWNINLGKFCMFQFYDMSSWSCPEN